MRKGLLTFFEWVLSITVFVARPIISIVLFELALELHNLTYRVLSTYQTVEDVGVVVSLDVYAIIMVIIGIFLIIPITSGIIFSFILYNFGSKNYKWYLKCLRKFEYNNLIFLIARTICRKKHGRLAKNQSSGIE